MDACVPRSLSSSHVWSAEDNFFSTSFNGGTDEDNDEETLKWAALEKLPTYTRARKGILNYLDGEMKEVDVKNLDIAGRRNLLERLVRVVEEDNERFLLRLKDRIDRVGIDLPTIEVRFQNLSIEAEAYVGSRGLPSLFNTILNAMESFAHYLRITPSKKRPFTILKDISGIIKPGRLTLLLGPPGSGKTSLLLALAGKLSPDLKVSGQVTYNGHTLEEFVPQRTAAYIGQHDLHMGEMTVRETIAFSARCQGVGSRYDMLMELLRREKSANIKPDPDIDFFMKASSLEGKETGVITDYTMKILGLDICADIFVGDAMLRGISGGQKRRLTTGEMIVGPAQALFMDEISTGLDSSTTFQIVKSTRQINHILGGTAVLSLLQPAPETYELFDDIIILSDGQIVFQGAREYALEFFNFMGFKCPQRKGVADFLQEIISRKDQHQYWARHDKPYKYVSTQNFIEGFKTFSEGKKLGRELSVPFDKAKSHPAALTTKKYGAKKLELLKACSEREFLLMKRNSYVYIFRIFRMLVMSIIMMTLFLRTTMHHQSIHDGWIYIGSFYFSTVIILLNGYSELSFTLTKLPVIIKQRDCHFYPSWVYAIPAWVIKAPFLYIEVSIWVILNYYIIGYDPSLVRFFKHYLFLLLVNQMSSGLFRFIGVIGRSMTVGSAFALSIILFSFLLSGFVIEHREMKKYISWGYWISPLMYSQNALSVNEFLGKSWSQILPDSNQTLGVSILKSRDMLFEEKWYWIGIAVLIGYVVLFNLLFTVALSYIKSSRKVQLAISREIFMGRETNENKLISYGDKKTSMYNSESDSSNEKKKTVLHFIPLPVTFENIKYSVDLPMGMKSQGIEENRLTLLKGVSGCFRPGVLTALMGVSGAGKTTLMDVLAGRKTGGYIEGKITISGYPKKQETFSRVTGYCEQNDIHSPNLTVYESLVFSAWLRLPPDVNNLKRKMFIEEVMELIELIQLKEALVGLPGVNGLSTEQRKRLTIAVELVANPSIIFMDEPTSGLDARAAAVVMRVVRNTVNNGRTVVCTIHQPSTDIFEAFDELYLMRRGGEEIYIGPLGHQSCHLIKYFEDIQGVPKIKQGYNPATWMMEVTSQAQEIALGINFNEVYRNSQLYQRNAEMIAILSKPTSGSCDLYFPTKYSQSFITQCIACLWKQQLSYWRNSSYVVVRFLYTLTLTLMFGIFFWDLGHKRDKQQDLLNAMGSMYGATFYNGVYYCSSVISVVAIERSVVYRERAAGMYSAFPYAFGQVMIEQPYIMVQSLVSGIIVYTMIGFEWTLSKFLLYMFFTYFTLLYFTYFGMLTIGITPSVNIASIVVSANYGLWNLFSGFIIPASEIPIWWRWYYWTCPMSWTLYGLLVSQYGDVETKLDETQTVAEFLKSYFGYNKNLLGVVGFMVVFYSIFFAFLFALAIKLLNFQKR